MSEALISLLRSLDLEPAGPDVFCGRSPAEYGAQLFGGQVAAQALAAAARTVEGAEVHTLHAHFLRPGDARSPTLFRAERLLDGRYFAARRVTASQQRRPILELTASFHRPEAGLDHQIAMPEAPQPEAAVDWQASLVEMLERLPAEAREWVAREHPVELRLVDPVDIFAPVKRPPRQLVWLRAAGRLDEASALQHCCVVVYASDMTVLDTALLPHGISWIDPRFRIVTVDHTMWFHRPFRADDWLLYAQESPSAHGARCLTLGHLFDGSGRLVVSVAQEGLIRRLYAGA